MLNKRLIPQMDDNKNYCFCELAPLYALDLLDEEEKAWVERQIATCPDLALSLIHI
jgi:hypothetical protein